MQIENQLVKVTQFNYNTIFDTVEAYPSVGAADTLMLTIFNNTSTNQSIFFEHTNSAKEVNPKSFAKVAVWKMPGKRTVPFYSANKTQKYLGLSSAIIFNNSNEKAFFWNLREYDESINQQYFEGANLNFSNYIPDVFTINSKVHTIYKANQMAMVLGNVGDSIYIDILNSGLMYHSVHFHGYHVKIIESNKSNEMIGWDKDSFPIDPGELISVLLVPHQPGLYPVHDHNLKAVTIGGNYPGGMIAMLKIEP